MSDHEATQEMTDTAAAPLTATRRRVSRAAVIAGGVAGALVLAMGIAAAVLLSGGGTQPEDILPADTVAFAKLDLDPAANQKIAFVQFASKLPKTFPHTTNDDPLAGIAQSAGASSADWKQIRAWIGDRYAIAAVPVRGSAAAVAVLAVTDEAAMRKYLAEQAPDIHIAIANGYAVLGELQSTVDAVVASSEHLAGNADFSSDVRALPGDQVAVAWIDITHAAALGKDALALLNSFGSVAAVKDSLDRAKGRAVIGVHFTSTSVVVTALGRGAAIANQSLDASAVTEDVENLPANTLAALSIAGIGDTLRASAAANKDLGTSLAEFGIRIDDLATVLSGPATLLALPDGDAANVLLMLSPADAAKAKRSLQRILSPITGGFLPVLVSGSHVIVGLSTSQAKKALGQLNSAQAHLRGTQLFDATVPHAGTAVLYVNAAASLPLLGVTGDAKTLGAVGLVARPESDGNSSATLTITLQSGAK